MTKSLCAGDERRRGAVVEETGRERRGSGSELRIEGASSPPVRLEEHPPEYDPQANGPAKVGVKLLKGHFRTTRSCL